MKKNNLTFKILCILISTDILETFTHLCFKKSVVAETAFQINAFQDLLVFARTVIFSPYLWIAFASVLITFILWSTILSRIDLSVAVPICSFSYVFIPLASFIFLHEHISGLRWLGIFFILIGVIFVSMSTKHKEGALR